MGDIIGIDRSTGKEIGYDDNPVKTAVIKITKDAFGWELMVNPKEKKIDLIHINEPDRGVEVERGGWTGDYWSQDPISFNGNTLPFPTLNMPYRKEHFFHLDLEWLNDYGNIKTSHTPSFEKNIFIRTNTNFTQFILVKSEIVREKMTRGCFKVYRGTGEKEHWLCFKREDVDTYNLINGSWKKDENKVGTYKKII
jgi:hypothetical protein